MDNELGTLLARESELLRAFAAQTRDIREILSDKSADEQQLLTSLEKRRAVLEELESVFGRLGDMPEAAPSRAAVVATLEEMLKLDEQNLELCGGNMRDMSAQARRMTQNRKVVSGYVKSSDDVDKSGFFDRKQ